MLKKISLLVAGALLAGVAGAPAALAQAPAIPKGFLLYEKQAARDAEHWYVSEDDQSEVWNIQCAPALLTGWKARRDAVYDTHIGGGERTNRQRGEQVFVFGGTRGAQKMMSRMRGLLRDCGRTAKVRVPRIGDEALAASRTIKATKATPFPQTQRFVAVRRGAAVALYWDMHNDAKPLRSLARHEADARRMAAKLCRIGGC